MDMDYREAQVYGKLALYGGQPVREIPWPTYDKGAVFITPDDEQAALRAIQSHLYFRYDYRSMSETECGRFEEKVCAYFKVKHALALSTGTAALTLAIMGANIPPGSLVACPGFTFVATPSAIVLAGCTPFLVEVDEHLHMDIDDLRRRWRPDIRAIMVVHMRGLPCNMDAVLRFAAEVGVPVLEDTIPALGAELNGRKLGTLGLAGAFSTHADTSINTGEGGFLITNDTELFARAVALSGAYEARFLRHFHGDAPPMPTGLHLPLLNFRMDEIRAALAAAQLDSLATRLHHFKRNYDYVQQQIANMDTICLRRPVAPDAYLGESLIFRLPSASAGMFAKAMCMEGIDARHLGSDDDQNARTFWNWRFLFKTDDVAAIKAHLPNTARYLAEAVDVPLSPTLSLEDCDQLVYALRKVVHGLNL